jgi:hypothetical protein
MCSRHLFSEVASDYNAGTGLPRLPLPQFTQLLLSICDAIPSHGCLSVDTLLLDSGLAHPIVLARASEDSDDLFNFGAIAFALTWMSFSDVHQIPRLTPEFVPPLPSCFPFFLQWIIDRCTIARRTTLAWVGARLRSFVEAPPAPNRLGIDPFLYERSVRIGNLQTLLMDVTPDSVEETVEDLKDFVVDVGMVESFVHYFVIAMFHRPTKVQLFAGLMVRLVAGLDGATGAAVKRAMLLMLPEKPASALTAFIGSCCRL